MSRTRSLAIALVLAALVIASVVLHVSHLRSRRLVVDELEHVHAAWLVSKGQTPYIDFFEHHPPLFYFVMAPALRHLPPGFDTLVRLRFLGLAAWLASGLAIVLLVKRVSEEGEAVAAGLFFLANTLLFDLGSLLYLDTFAAPLVAGSALSLAGARLRFRHVMVATTSLGLAVLFTQKAGAAGLGLCFALIAAGRREREEGGHPWPAILWGSAAGAAASVSLLALLLGRVGLAGLWQSAILLNLGWKARHFPDEQISTLFRYDGFAVVLAAWGLVLALTDLLRRRGRPQAAEIPAAYLASLIAGIFVLPVVWEEYFVLLIPFLCAVAGIALLRAVRALRPAAWESVGLLVALALVLAATGWRLSLSENPLRSWTAALVLGAWLVMIGHAALRSRRGLAPHWALLALPALSYCLVLQTARLHRAGNNEQRARLDYVMQETRPEEPYFDGYSGYGVFRPHAYHYWFLHEEVQAMLSREAQGPAVVSTLQTVRPRLVTVDEWTLTLPPEVGAYIHENYRPTAFPDIWRRREPE